MASVGCSRSSFNGIIDEIPQISIDNFENIGKRAYLLSHCHIDHTQGLFSAELLESLEESNVYIYMSEPSAAIIIHESVDKRIVEYIKPLKLGRTLITIPGNPEHNDDLYINLTLIPAGHCFGSVMFLFETIMKTILYTGDFRICSNNLTNYTHFHTKEGDAINIDSMYVDTTFQGYQHENFPKRSECVEDVVNEIRKWLDCNASNRIALHTSAKYGYEYVFNEIFKKLGVKVYVNDQKWRLYSQFPDQLPGVTNNDYDTRIHLCMNFNEHMKSHKKCMPHEKVGAYLYIHFSALKWQDYCIDEPMLKKSKMRVDVCFATHCSRSELIYFINYFSPKRIIGFPEPYNPENSRKSICDSQVTPVKRKLEVVTKSSEKKDKISRKVNNRLLRQIFD